MRSSLLKNHIISTRQNTSPHFSSKPLFTSNHLANYQEQSIKCVPDYQKSFLSSLNNRISCSSLSSSLDSNTGNYEHERVKPCMYAPNPISSVSEVLVKVSRCFPEWAMENLPNSLWSNPFFLVPPSGSSTILLPQSSSNAALILSVTSSEVAEPYAGRTSAICFQPRYVISNACSKDLCYKQKGTDILFHLGVREHAHLHWTDTTRDLLISICYDEPGWQWSGGFLPDHLGDTQVKLKSYVSGAVNMIRVEVQNADVSVEDEKIVGSLHGNSSTNLILLSDDNTGYMPYRIDNFSKERLRIYQHKCDAYETMVHSYTSCLYAWDEPCYPHRLIVEVPGERVMGSYALDDVREYLPVHLASTSEKPERTLFLSVHAEGATKVLNILDSNYHILSDAKQSNIPHFRGKKRHDHKQDKSFDYMEKLSVEIPCIGISLINSYPQELLFACAKDITIDLLQSLDQQRISFQISSLQIDNQLRITPYPVILSFDGEYKSNPAADTTIKDDLARTRGDRISQMPCDASCDPVFYLAASKWRKDDISFISFEYISLRIADFRLELEQELILSLFDFFTNVSTRFEYEFLLFSGPLMHPHSHNREFLKVSTAHVQAYGGNQLLLKNASPLYNAKTKVNLSLPTVVPIGAPWQKIYLLARTQRKVYVEVFELAPIKLTLSFSSAPWMLRNRIFTSGEFLFHRGLMALADVEGARIHLRQLTIAHHMASWESIQEILIRHYIRQLIHEMYKVFGSAGVIGNPMGFARSVGLGIKDFLSVPARSIVQSPSGLISGMAEGTSSLLSNTGIVAFTYDDQAASRLENQQIGRSSHSKGVINEVLEGLTGLLQSPIKGAEKHGLPGVLSGIALGITGLVAKPAASILEVTGKTALSIRNRSKPYQMRSQRFRVRLPRPLSSELPLRPYSWEEAVGTSVLMEADDSLKLKEEALVFCKALKEAGKFVIITERLVLIVFCPGLVNWGKPEFPGIAADLEWIIESEIGLESMILVDNDKEVIHIVGSSPDTLSRQNPHSPRRGSGGGSRARTVRWNNFSTPLPLFQTNLELTTEEDAENLLKTLLSTIETGKERGWGCGHFLHRSHTK
ncbi:Vacuolar protein sorting-associated protein [Quillaja saponaria]|uniref:Vacuolar protein sorting-associated protein n=1 Tax=Quillaja saponaria TaxID=32244 RepID=A0AAD7QB94_QUISA|nr:Vacuolar protein sorting-associated protein [Quillaja saponaria]